MLTAGVHRSETVNEVAPERRARNSAVGGLDLHQPLARRSATCAESNFVSA